MRKLYLGLFAIGVAFIGIGISGQRTFLYVGLLFLLMALFRFLRTAKQ
jgi:hypothetical protein